MAKSALQEFKKGLWAEIPPFRLVLGLCPTLAVTKSVENGIGMGIAVYLCPGMFQYLDIALQKYYTQKSPNSLLHNCYCNIRHRGGTTDAGVYLPSVP